MLAADEVRIDQEVVVRRAWHAKGEKAHLGARVPYVTGYRSDEYRIVGVQSSSAFLLRGT